MEKRERDAIMRQGVVLPETPRDRRDQAGLEEDLRSIPFRGRPLRLRARNFRPREDAYLAAARGPLPYMLRLHEIEVRIADAEERLAEAWRVLAEGCQDDAARFARAWQSLARAWPFFELNDLIERHNRWYPIESRLPMDPRTGDYALVNGRDYRLRALDEDWVLERFPAVLEPETVQP
ncbi:MAG: hypothetical protein ACRDNY_12750 [Gaiellaceae bacterium]